MLSSQITHELSFYFPHVKETEGKNLRLVALLNLFLLIITLPLNILYAILMAGMSSTAAIITDVLYCLGGGFTKTWSTITEKVSYFTLTQWVYFFVDMGVYFANMAKFIAILFSPRGSAASKRALNQDAHQCLSPLALYTLQNIDDTIFFGLRMVLGAFKSFHFYGLNPESLSETQAEHPPVLLLHGWLHNQSAWLPLAAYLKQHQYQGAVFTVNLPDDPRQASSKDIEIIQQKLEEIQALYPSMTTCYIAGHSRGTEVIKAFMTPLHSTLKFPQTHFKIISLDGCYNCSEQNSDLLVLEAFRLRCSHTGILRNLTALESCHTFFDTVTPPIESPLHAFRQVLQITSGEKFNNDNPRP